MNPALLRNLIGHKLIKINVPLISHLGTNTLEKQ